MADKYRKMYDKLVLSNTNYTSKNYIRSMAYQELTLPKITNDLDVNELNDQLNCLNAETDHVLNKYKKMIALINTYKSRLADEDYYEYTKNIWVCIKLQMPSEDDFTGVDLNNYIVTEREIAKIYETTIVRKK